LNKEYYSEVLNGMGTLGAWQQKKIGILGEDRAILDTNLIKIITQQCWSFVKMYPRIIYFRGLLLLEKE
jgi:hypothetical protein